MYPIEIKIFKIKEEIMKRPNEKHTNICKSGLKQNKEKLK
jgi:hypothetical protein